MLGHPQAPNFNFGRAREPAGRAMAAGMFPAPTASTQLLGHILMSQEASGSTLGQPSEEEVALAVSKERKERRRTSGKASIARTGPLKVPLRREVSPGPAFRAAWQRTAGELSEAEQRRAVEQALEVFRQLPPSSSYAQHRIRVLEKALQLLDKARWAGRSWQGVGLQPNIFHRPEQCARQPAQRCSCQHCRFNSPVPMSPPKLSDGRSSEEQDELQQLLSQLRI